MRIITERIIDSLKSIIIAVILAGIICSILLKVAGENPHVLLDALYNAFFTDFGLGYTLYYATPLIFTGLSVGIVFHAGLFNIGAEGQLYIGSLAVVVLSFLMPNPPWIIGVGLSILVASLAGAFWGSIAGLLKAFRGSHEVIVTILLNFVAFSLVDYCILYPLKNHEVQNSETGPISASYMVPFLSDMFKKIGLDLFQSTPVNATLFIGIVAAVILHLVIFHTSVGYELRVIGQSPRAGAFAGISPSKNIMLAFAIGGALAGLVGVNEVMGNHHKLILGSSAEYGFTGIAVALVARNRPIVILVSAFLFGGLQTSARELEFMSDKISKEMGLVLQAVLIASTTLDYLIKRIAGGRIRKKLRSFIKP